ncbi:unnamed protein product [Ectocarpus sp. 13 AM-2016]
MHHPTAHQLTTLCDLATHTMPSRYGNAPAKRLRFAGATLACLTLISTGVSVIHETYSHQHRSLQRRSRTLRSGAQAWSRTRPRQSAWTVRGGYKHGSSAIASSSGSNSGNSVGQDGFAPSGETTAADSNIDKLAADLRATRDHIAADIHARGEAIAADLKGKQEKIVDEVLRERSPEAFGELGGHASSYDSATAGMDVANRRSFFLGIRRVLLLVQVVELLAACMWQAAFPFGGLAGFITASSTTNGEGGTPNTAGLATLKDIVAGEAGDGRGPLGLALAACLAQFSVYTMLLVWFGCDRVVLRGVRVTAWEHGAAAVWALTRLMTGPGGKLTHLVACAWLAGMAFLCAYFGRQL